MPSPSSTPPAHRLALSAKALRTGESSISFLIDAAAANPDLISFAAGLVDEQTLPVEAVRALADQVLSDDRRARAVLQYETTLGLSGLRRHALAHLCTLEGKSAAQLGLTPDDVIITTGSQQALYLIGDVLIDPGDIVVAANPCYFVYTATLQSLGATVLPVPMDDGGMDADAVERLLHKLEAEGRLPRVKLIYCTSYYQNPTGLTLSAQRRPKLVDLARRFSKTHRILVLEDAAYRELRYDGDPLPSIKSFDPGNEFVMLTQTFSKPFAPGLKTGYTFLPPDVRDAVLNQKGNHDFGSPSVTQHLALAALSGTAYAEQVKRLQSGYRAKRDAMLSALDRHMPQHPGIRWTRPAGGLYVWLSLPESISTSRQGGIFDEAVRHGVLYVPGEYCFQPDQTGTIPRNHIRLSFGHVEAARIDDGIRRLAGVIAAALSDRQSPTANRQSPPAPVSEHAA